MRAKIVTYLYKNVEKTLALDKQIYCKLFHRYILKYKVLSKECYWFEQQGNLTRFLGILDNKNTNLKR